MQSSLKTSPLRQQQIKRDIGNFKDPSTLRLQKNQTEEEKQNQIAEKNENQSKMSNTSNRSLHVSIDTKITEDSLFGVHRQKQLLEKDTLTI